MNISFIKQFITKKNKKSLPKLEGFYCYEQKKWVNAGATLHKTHQKSVKVLSEDEKWDF